MEREAVVAILTDASISKRRAGFLADKIMALDGYTVGAWNATDVHTQANNDGLKLTADEADQVLERVSRKWDATIGINWDLISLFITDVGVGKKLTKKEINQVKDGAMIINVRR